MATAKAEEGTLTAEAGPVPAVAPTPQDDTTVPTPPQFYTGWVKQDPDSKAVAVRTNIPDPYSDHDWGVMTVDRGGHYASYDEVQNWTDLSA
jgi:hypothetical protein